MGSQYIGDTTIKISNEQEVKQEIKKQRGHPNTVFGHLLVFYDGFEMFISENDKFSTKFPTFSTMEKVDG